MELLLDNGYSWNSLYTQCTLGNMLVAYRTDSLFDPDFCETNQVSRSSEELDLIENELTSDTLRLLKKYFEDYYDYGGDDDGGNSLSSRDTGAVDTIDVDYPLSKEFPDTYSDEDISGPYEKKDEFVNVHKYLKSHKRDPLYSGESTELGPLGALGYGYRSPESSSNEALGYDYRSPESSSNEGGEYYYDISDDIAVPESRERSLEIAGSPEASDYDLYDYQDILEKLTPKDIELLQDYLSEYAYESSPSAEEYDQGISQEYEDVPIYEDVPMATMEDSAMEADDTDDDMGGWLEQPDDAEGGWQEQPLGNYDSQLVMNLLREG